MAKRGNPNFVKGGASGNPNGRPKGYADFALRCREWADAHGFGFLADLAKTNDPRIKLDTTKFLIERGYGKSLENVKLGVDDDLAKIIQEARNRTK